MWHTPRVKPISEYELAEIIDHARRARERARAVRVEAKAMRELAERMVQEVEQEYRPALEVGRTRMLMRRGLVAER